MTASVSDFDGSGYFSVPFTERKAPSGNGTSGLSIRIGVPRSLMIVVHSACKSDMYVFIDISKYLTPFSSTSSRRIPSITLGSQVVIPNLA